PVGAGGLELESLSYVELSVHIEREFGIQFSDEAVDGFATATLGELVSDIRTRTAGADADTDTGTDTGPPPLGRVGRRGPGGCAEPLRREASAGAQPDHPGRRPGVHRGRRAGRPRLPHPRVVPVPAQRAARHRAGHRPHGRRRADLGHRDPRLPPRRPDRTDRGCRPMSTAPAAPEDVLVTGYGVFTGHGFGEEALRDGVFAGRAAFRTVERFDTGRFRGRYAAAHGADGPPLPGTAPDPRRTPSHAGGPG
ncbi:hypothetical protein GTW37_39340, partial [Streptomyces sp. SID4931]|nr:hypothetical protein [Streptomyces sp. SID4931]